MVNNWRRPRAISTGARGVLAAVVIATLGCGGSTPVQPTAAPIVPPPAPPPLSGIYTLTVSTTQVAPGGLLTVSWTVPSEAPAGVSDWISLFRVTDPNTKYGWYTYTEGAKSGTATLTAPLQLGKYEFRYLQDDGFFDVVRSAIVTVDVAR